jgi:hypothetical protein
MSRRRASTSGGTPAIEGDEDGDEASPPQQRRGVEKRTTRVRERYVIEKA